MRIPVYAPWEVGTNLLPAVRPGLLPQSALNLLTLACAVAIGGFLWLPLGWAAVPIGLVFGRLVALDLTTYTLPNVYTIPLLTVGLFHALTHEQIAQALIASLLLMFFNRTVAHGNLMLTRGIGMGGGDYKLLAALFAFMPLTSAFWAIAVGSFLWLPVAFAKPKAMVPFGVPLIIGWVIMLWLPHLPNWLFSTIS